MHDRPLKFLFFLSIILITVSFVWITKTPINKKFDFKINLSCLYENSTACINKLKAKGQPFKDILLAINFNHPYYSSIPTLEEYYKPLFKKYIFCGPKKNYAMKYDVIKIKHELPEYGFYGYQCLVEAIWRYPGYQGYLYINDDMIINWWNYLELDVSKIWYADSFPDLEQGHKIFSVPNDWYQQTNRGEKCSKFYSDMENGRILSGTGMHKMYDKNTERKRICLGQLSDIFYIPARFASKFALIAKKFYDRRIFLEVAVPMSIYSLDYKSNIIYLNGMYLQRKYGWGGDWKKKTTIAWKEYNFNIHFLHPYKFHGANETLNTQEFEYNIGDLSRKILEDGCLDEVFNKKFKNMSSNALFQEDIKEKPKK